MDTIIALLTWGILLFALLAGFIAMCIGIYHGETLAILLGLLVGVGHIYYWRTER